MGMAHRARKAQEAVNALGAGKPEHRSIDDVVTDAVFRGGTVETLERMETLWEDFERELAAQGLPEGTSLADLIVHHRAQASLVEEAQDPQIQKRDAPADEIRQPGELSDGQRVLYLYDAGMVGIVQGKAPGTHGETAMYGVLWTARSRSLAGTPEACSSSRRSNRSRDEPAIR